MLWHGAPGTGTTTAVRALLHAWRSWADAVVVTDPDEMLQDGRHLRRVLLDADDDDDRWKLFVLEDAEALLRTSTGGAAMSKLLNLADGLLGHGLRCLFLITTNEPLGVIHPAVVRPGRCLAKVEAGALSQRRTAGLLGRPVDRAMTLAEIMTAAPALTRDTPVAVGQYLCCDPTSYATGPGSSTGGSPAVARRAATRRTSQECSTSTRPRSTRSGSRSARLPRAGSSSTNWGTWWGLRTWTTRRR